MKRLILVLICLMIGCLLLLPEKSGVSAREGLWTELMNVSIDNPDIQEKINQIAKKHGATGIQVAIVDNGMIAGTYNYGYATLDESEMTIHHKMRVASLSKMVVGMTAMMMQEDGILDIDDPIEKYWDTVVRSPYYPNHPITIETILTHTSSLISYGDSETLGVEKVLERFEDGYTGVIPGDISANYYNNYAFRVLGMTLEKAAKQTLDDYLDNRLYNILDIDASFASGDIENLDQLTTLYQETGEVGLSIEKQLETHHPDNYGSEGAYFAGGLTISAYDLAKLLTLFVNDGLYQNQQLISERSIASMETYLLEPLADGSYQAMPLFYYPKLYGRDQIYYHIGSNYGVLNCLSYDPIKRDGIIVLTSGATRELDDYQIYTICSEINEYIYDLI